MLFLASHGFRCIAHDRRGHGRSSQPWQGNDMDTYADDLAELIEKLNLKNEVLVGFSAGGGEVARYIGRHGSKRVAKADRSQFYREIARGSFYGASRPGAKVSQGVMDRFWLQGITAGHHNTYACIKAFSETDFTADLKKFTIPTLIIHGNDDQIVPIAVSALRASDLIDNAILKIYEGAPHGLTDTHKDQLNADLLEFLR
jgi:non-heme chloroperoxidase